MKEIRILALGTILVLGFALGAQAQTETTNEDATADTSTYQVGQPDSTAEGDASNYEIGQPDSISQGEGKVTPAAEDPAPLGNTSLSPDDWSAPPSM
jgi:uncharacterized low-complexity protein